MTNPIVAKIQALWDEHITNVYMFPSDETLRAFFRRDGYSEDAIDEAIDLWWDDADLTNLS